MKRWMIALMAVALLALLLPLGWGATPAGAAPASQLDGDDWARIQAAGKLVVGTSADYPPFEFYNSNYELDGFDIAFIREIADRLGLEVEFKDFAFSGLLDALRLGQVDVAISAISVTPDRQQIVDFTNLYYVSEDAVLGGPNFSGPVTNPGDFAGRRVGVERGTTFQAWAQQHLVEAGIIAQTDLVAYDDVSAIIRDLRNGTIDAAMMGVLTARINAAQFADVQVIGTKLNLQRYAIAARKGSTLINPLNQAIISVQADGTFAQLVTHYLNVLVQDVTPGGGPVINEPAPPAVVEVPCVNGMEFVADLNLDDLNMSAPPVMRPGQTFAKSWRVRNSGTCDWPADYQLMYVKGNRPEAQMGGQPINMGRVVRPGETIDLTATLVAPTNFGVFQGFWQMRDNRGTYFGQVVWVGISVPDPNPPTPTPVPPPPPQGINANFRADALQIDAGQCTTLRWNVDNVNAVFLIDGGRQEGVGGNDARNVCPGQPTTYVLRVFDRNNIAFDFPLTINVVGAQPGINPNFRADNAWLNAGQCTTLRWNVDNVNAVFLIDGGRQEGVGGNDARNVCPGATFTYVLRVFDRNNIAFDFPLTITVAGAPPPPPASPRINEFWSNTNSIQAGQCVNFRWRTENAQGVNLVRSGANLVQGGPRDGEHNDCPGQAGYYDYQLTAYGNGSDSRTIGVEVRAPGGGGRPRDD